MATQKDKALAALSHNKKKQAGRKRKRGSRDNDDSDDDFVPSITEQQKRVRERLEKVRKQAKAPVRRTRGAKKNTRKAGAKTKAPVATAPPASETLSATEVRERTHARISANVTISRVRKGNLNEVIPADRQDAATMVTRAIGKGKYRQIQGTIAGAQVEEAIENEVVAEANLSRPDETTRVYLPVKATKIPVRPGQATRLEKSGEADGSGFNVVFSSLLLQTIETELFGDESFVLSKTGFCVPSASFEALIAYGISTHEFNGWTAEEDMQRMGMYLLETYKGRPQPNKPGGYTCEVALWSRSLVERVMDLRPGDYRDPSVGFCVMTLYQEAKRGMEQARGMTRDQALKCDKFTFWHFVTFVFAWCNVTVESNENIFYMLMGILWRDMSEHGKAIDYTSVEIDESKIGLKPLDKITPVDHRMWAAMAGLMEAVLFEETDRPYLATVQFNVELFMAEPNVFFNIIVSEMIKAQRRLKSLPAGTALPRPEEPTYHAVVHHPSLADE